MEQEIAALINEDHYYDEVKPYDAMNQVEIHKSKRDTKMMLVMGIVIVALVGVIWWSIREVFL